MRWIFLINSKWILTLMENISRASGFLEEFHNTEIRVFTRFRVFPVVLRSRRACFPSCLIPVLLPTYYVRRIIFYWYEDFPRKLRDEETSVFKNVELLNRRASKIVMLPKRPSDQSKTSSNYGRATYSTHSSPTITSSTTSFFEISRSIFTAHDSTTTKTLDHSLFLFFFNGFLHSPPP